ncbi:hypothetical protein D3C78_914160 [compost metagenome]
MQIQELSSHQKITQHLIQQRALSTKDGFEDSDCKYRSALGHKCAVGCLIPDEEYLPEMEGKIVARLDKEFPTLLPKDISVEALEKWQRYHDFRLLLLDGRSFCYARWVESGDEGHHPDVVAKVIAAEHGIH